MERFFLIQGKYEEAEPLFKMSLDIKKKVLGVEHPEYATGLAWLGEILRTQVFVHIEILVLMMIPIKHDETTI